MSRYVMNTFLSFASSCFLPVLYNLSPSYKIASTTCSTLFRMLLARMSLLKWNACANADIRVLILIRAKAAWQLLSRR